MADKKDDLIPDTFIVTVSSTVGDFDSDMELPAELPVGNMRGKLLTVLRALDGEKFSTWQGCRLRYKNRLLQDTDTLAQVGTFDGGRLVVVEG